MLGNGMSITFRVIGVDCTKGTDKDLVLLTCCGSHRNPAHVYWHTRERFRSCCWARSLCVCPGTSSMGYGELEDPQLPTGRKVLAA